ncbi:MAG: HisA/HisF-related TIM barrel protein [Burkholderiales bacterium]
MKIIPVIDLMQGQVVQARHGERHAYRPIASQLCPGSNALDIVAALLHLHLFPALYVADLDAIMQTGSNISVIENLRACFPALELWVDCGIADAATYAAWRQHGLGHAVIGSEARPGAEFLEQLAANGDALYPLLSLDFKPRFQGDATLLGNPHRWLQHVIVMTLTRVGSAAGPDCALLQSLQQRAPEKKFYAAGGVRGARDLETLEQGGAHGVLLASALHQRRLSSQELAEFSR